VWASDGVDIKDYLLAEGSKSELTVGRHPDNDVMLPHNSVSRYHARIEWRHGQIAVTDVGSTNGTLLDGGLLDRHKSSPWPTAKVLQLGPSRLSLAPLGSQAEELPAAEAEQPPSVALPEGVVKVGRQREYRDAEALLARARQQLGAVVVPLGKSPQ